MAEAMARGIRRCHVQWQEAAGLHEQQAPRRSGRCALHIATAYQALTVIPSREHLSPLNDWPLRRRSRLSTAHSGACWVPALSAGPQVGGRHVAESSAVGARAGDRATATILNDVGSLYYAQQRYADAVKAYEESIATSSTFPNRQLTARARINRHSPGTLA
jgi:hypothetical protein